MEPATHILTGACLARAGLNRKAAYATAAMALAAEFPDIDTLWSLRGPVSGFEHHRGITHTFLGLPFEAALIVLFFVVLDRLRTSKVAEGGRKRTETAAPVRWPVLYGFVLLALLSHLLLDYTNNYGLRPFFPFNTHWFAASIVFIFDPLIFVSLLAGLFFPSIFALVGQEIGAQKRVFRGAGWARAALLLICGIWGFRTYEHCRAVALADAQTLRAPSQLSEQQQSPEPVVADGSSQPDASRPLLRPIRALASPDPLSPFRWYTVTDFGPAYLLGTVDARNGSFEADRVLDKLPKSRDLALAEASHLGRVYLDWSPMPWVSVSDDPSTRTRQQVGEATVLFQDTRFMGGNPWLNRGSLPALTGVVNMRGGEILDEGMDGRFER